MKKLLTLFISIFCTTLCLGAESNVENIRLSFVNNSDYRVAFSIVSLEDGEVSTDLPPVRADLAVGQTIEYSVPQELTYDVFFSTEPNEVATQTNLKYGIEGLVELSKGCLYATAGRHNYAVGDAYKYRSQQGDNKTNESNKKISLSDAIKGCDDLPRNINPIDGALDLAMGMGFFMKGAASMLGLARKSKMSFIIEPGSVMHKPHVGVRVVINNYSSSFISGIAGRVAPFRDSRFTITRVGGRR